MIKTLLIGMHGGFQTTEREASIDYLDFLEMSELNKLESDSIKVWLPQARNRVWGLYFGKDMRDIRLLQDGISTARREGVSKIIACGFSEGATALVHYTRYIQFDGILCCSAVVPPMDWLRPSYWNGSLPEHKSCDAMFWAGDEERQKNRDAASELRTLFADLGANTAYNIYQGRHHWPKEWNYKILEFFNLK